MIQPLFIHLFHTYLYMCEETAHRWRDTPHRGGAHPLGHDASWRRNCRTGSSMEVWVGTFLLSTFFMMVDSMDQDTCTTAEAIKNVVLFYFFFLKNWLLHVLRMIGMDQARCDYHNMAYVTKISLRSYYVFANKTLPKKTFFIRI
jgi:hypothetical protein